MRGGQLKCVTPIGKWSARIRFSKMELDNIKDELSGDWLFRDQIMIQGDSVMSLNLNSFLN